MLFRYFWTFCWGGLLWFAFGLDRQFEQTDKISVFWFAFIYNPRPLILTDCAWLSFKRNPLFLLIVPDWATNVAPLSSSKLRQIVPRTDRSYIWSCCFLPHLVPRTDRSYIWSCRFLPPLVPRTDRSYIWSCKLGSSFICSFCQSWAQVVVKNYSFICSFCQSWAQLAGGKPEKSTASNVASVSPLQTGPHVLHRTSSFICSSCQY